MYTEVESLSYYKGYPKTASTEFANLGTRTASNYYAFRFAGQIDGTQIF
ncbi:hypothetical protein C8N40_109167 [Pontibacter mucosus]|uniref:Uncharacterized protein n=2 Tax=Pontibacter mucosus TaxID=1649266 RepID=A0A2T5YED0_9BACT|nr:hypothetical protein C8N40_109167 [Pontibacter mucosus]